MFSVGLVDNDRRSLESLRRIFVELVDGLSVKWMVTKGEEAERLCLDPERRPDVLLIDMSLDGMQGPVVCRRMRERLSVMPILAMTAFPTERYSAKVARAGAQGICSKNSETDLVKGIGVVVQGKTYGVGFDTATDARKRLLEERANNSRRLTDKEMEVMDHVADGLTDREIAAKLGIALSTVRKHVQNAKSKMQAKNRFQAMWMWFNGED